MSNGGNVEILDSFLLNIKQRKVIQLPLQVYLSLWPHSFRLCFFLLFWRLATDWISWGGSGGILSRCCPLPAPPRPSPCHSSSLFIWWGNTSRVFRGSATSWFIGRGLWPCWGVWRHTVFCAVTCRCCTFLPTGLSSLFLKHSKKQNKTE